MEQEPTAQPEAAAQEATNLLKQIYEAYQGTKAENAKLQAEIDELAKFIKEEVPKIVDSKVGELYEDTKKSFLLLGNKLNEIKSQTGLAVPGPTGTPGEAPQLPGIGGTIQKIVDALVQRFTATSAQAAASTVDPMRMEMVKTIDKIQLMYAKKFATDTAKAFGLPEAAVETAEHIIVSPK